ncbi:hypothetical protein MC7420_3738 [Coleofasciculus chthonoplastes PCC 7420]|uniref:Uncharacterized protein n=1 Tax=Coleofasciculus chthonoplastes PCC 7420 TaxID=118168 RepID=B4VWW7_9CYAN|nr:hypothetical protein MC7420_3738 [Coleofasciculus chthonoplastes PCC 7420]
MNHRVFFKKLLIYPLNPRKTPYNPEENDKIGLASFKP